MEVRVSLCAIRRKPRLDVPELIVTCHAVVLINQSAKRIARAPLAKRWRLRAYEIYAHKSVSTRVAYCDNNNIIVRAAMCSRVLRNNVRFFFLKQNVRVVIRVVYRFGGTRTIIVSNTTRTDSYRFGDSERGPTKF